ncbi:hypothetical protein TRAPUB_3791 [Trametes pubescens]|uniref:Velvet domain-containing protein n=1 Tax=Trametes pubescens TaxID=154538 RepID=A0A1M2VCJ5_TRAPU|nr:hypothetical protein TRAPUB_3791 [Trametes pubescens]
MIQKTNARVGSSAAASIRQNTASDSPNSWGKYSGRKHYSLEVVQHPIRARMCGFGDKDRRPLAPAAVAKMIVTRDDGTLVDVDEVDCSFFLVTVDLWSADGKHEMNLVLHPTSADRYVPANTPKNKRRGTVTTNTSNQRSSRQSPAPSLPTPSTAQYSQQPSNTNYPAQSYPFPAQPAPVPESNSFQPVHPYAPQPDSNAPSWGYSPSGTTVDRAQSYGTPALPTVTAVNRTTPPSNPEPATAAEYGAPAQAGANPPQDWQIQTPVRDDQGNVDYRTWPQQGAPYTSVEGHPMPPAPTPHTADPREGAYGSVAPGGTSDAYPQQARYSQEPYTPVQTSPSQSLDSSMYASASYAQQQHQQQTQSQYHQGSSYQEPTPPSTIPPLPRHTYTRTLVGPLAANACRLLDEHRKPGVFFLFQDLSIRTEGTFRLRLRLMNVGAPPAPEPRAAGVHTDVSAVLAQTFTEPFVVFSAKRFPGVPDTTALSIALGNQGQKLPLRNRNGSNKQGRKRRRDGSDGSGDESEDA